MTKTPAELLPRPDLLQLASLPLPRKFTLVAGKGEGRTPLNAFDRALLAAGIGNLNLLRVSSILPPHAEPVDRLDVQPGSLLPTAYGTIGSSQPGDLIAAAVGVGIATRENYGVIMEFEGHCGQAEAEETVARMVEEAFETRGLPLNQCLVRGVEHRVERHGAVLAAVALWY